MTPIIKYLCLAVISAIAFDLSAQEKRITPVETDDKKPPKPVLHYYDKHGKPLDEPVYVLTEETGTVASSNSKPLYPLITSLNVGINFWDGIMMAAGQKYGGFDIWAELPLHNWFCPVIELGLGRAKDTPDDGNFTYNCKPSFYTKIGLNYNFLYKSSPDYQFHIGLRGGFSSFSYEITDITISSPYWEQYHTFDITGQKSTALYGEALLGLKVKIWKQFSMGWSFRYKFMFNCTDGSNSSPWYIPGYGSRTGSISASFSLIYTLPLKKQASLH